MIVLSWPFTTATKVLKLRDPELNDIEASSVSAVYKTMMSGKIFGYKSTTGERRLSWRFREISRRKALEVRDFMLSAAGDWIRLVDFDNQSWRVKITSTPLEIATVSVGLGSTEARPEANSFDLEFEGAKL